MHMKTLENLIVDSILYFIFMLKIIKNYQKFVAVIQYTGKNLKLRNHLTEALLFKFMLGLKYFSE